MPAITLTNVPLSSRKEMGGRSPAADDDLNRISFGRTEPVTVRADSPDNTAELAAYLRDNPTFRFVALAFTCSFVPDEDEPIMNSKVAVHLKLDATSTLGQTTDQFIAWSLQPERLFQPVSQSTTWSLGSQAKLGPVEMDASVHQTTAHTAEDNFIVATGMGSSVAQWYFRRTASVVLEGMHDLGLIVRAPTQAVGSLEVRMTAEIQRRLAGIVPYQAQLPPELRLVAPI
jgi:hypothetical protein